MGIVSKIMTRQVVYYILSGTPRASQKCFQSNLIVEFSGENHLFFDLWKNAKPNLAADKIFGLREKF